MRLWFFSSQVFFSLIHQCAPSFRLNSCMSLDDFKSIYYMEWGHRILGRTIGLAFVLPLGYFALRRRLARSLRVPLLSMAGLLGAQGALGWYMVQSGLEPANFAADGAVPRVSQYRLAAHLGAALVLYAGMFSAALSVKDDWRFARGDAWGRLADGRTCEEVLRNPLVRRFKVYAALVTGLVLLTALSGTRKPKDQNHLRFSPKANTPCHGFRVFRRIRCWPRCRSRVQRIPANGWPPCAPSKRTSLAALRRPSLE